MKGHFLFPVQALADSCRQAAFRFKVMFCLGLFFYCLSVNGQKIRTDAYGTGSTQETNPYTDNNGISFSKTTIKDGNGKVREEKHKATYSKPNGLGGTDTYTIDSLAKYDCNGAMTYNRCSITKNGKEIHYGDVSLEVPSPGTGGISTPGSGYKRDTDDNGKETKQQWDPVMLMWKQIAMFTGEGKSPEPAATICGQTGNCQPKVEIFAGPSILIADFGTEKKTLFGGQLVANLHITSRISVGVSAGIYAKKIGMTNLNRSLIMVDGQYAFGDQKDCNRNWLAEVHVVAGVINEKYGSSKGSGAVFGAGPGIECRISRKLFAKVQPGILAVKWKNDDKLNMNYDITAGLNLKLGSK